MRDPSTKPLSYFFCASASWQVALPVLARVLVGHRERSILRVMNTADSRPMLRYRDEALF